MKQRTRLFSIFLALVMCLGFLPGTALADDDYYPGSRPNTYRLLSNFDDVLEYHREEAGELAGITNLTIITFVDDVKTAEDSYTLQFFEKDFGSYCLYELIPVVNPDDRPLSYELCTPDGELFANSIQFSPDGTILAYVSAVDYAHPVEYTENLALYAKFTTSNGNNPPSQPENKTSEVWFSANGGTMTAPDSVNIPYYEDTVNGEKMLHTLTHEDGTVYVFPAAVREGYTFDGWYTASVGGTQASEKTDLTPLRGQGGGVWSSDQVVLWAHWIENAPESQALRIDFFPNGGLITEIGGYSRDVLLSEDYDDPKLQAAWAAGIGIDRYSEVGWLNTGEDGKTKLPTVSRTGYTFDGWFILPESFDLWGKLGDNYVQEVVTDFKGMTQASASTVFDQEVTLAARWVPAAGKDCTVTYDWNGAAFLQPIEPQTVAYGGKAPLYTLSADIGHTLKGWATKDGVLWDSRTMTVTEDMTLYAVWEPAFTDEDDFSFNNGEQYFDNYNVSDRYLKYLVRSETPYYQSYIRDYSKNQKWGGSCFGMSAVYAMQKGKALDVNVFQSGAKGLRDLAAPTRSNNVRDLVNFYMLAQMTDPAYYYKESYLSETNLSARYGRLLSDIQGSSGYSVLGFNSAAGGHAVVAKSASNGRVAIWDPNFPGVDITLTVSGGTAKFSGPSGLSDAFAAYNTNTELKYVMPLETRSQNYDASNLQSVFKSGADASAADAKASRATLASTVGDFTVVSADGRTAAVKDGEPSGELTLRRVCIDGAEDPVYRYELDDADARSLTVTLAAADAVVQVVTGGVYVRVEAAKLNTVTVSDEAVSTSAASAGQQTITMVSEKLDDTWNKVTVTGKDTGFQVGAASGQVTVASDSGVTATVTGENADTWEEGQAQSVTAAPEGTVLTTAQLSGGAAQPAVSDAFPFTDVEESRWFRPAVEAAYNAGLVKGLTDTTYGPQNTLTLAESVTLAARIYAEAHGETAPSGGVPWYKTAYDYCVEKGIIDGAVFALDDMTRTATRFEMVTILDGAVPAQRMDNSVAVESIPDLEETDAYGEVVYRWYRAGILTGNADGSFAGERSITRAEVAQILCTINRLI